MTASIDKAHAVALKQLAANTGITEVFMTYLESARALDASNEELMSTVFKQVEDLYRIADIKISWLDAEELDDLYWNLSGLSHALDEKAQADYLVLYRVGWLCSTISGKLDSLEELQLLLAA